MKLFFFWYISCFFGLTALAQESQAYRCFCNSGGLCSATLVLYADSSFVYEHGCEASSHLSFGEWRKKGNSLYFTQPKPQTFAAIKEVQSTSIPGDSIWVTVLDRKGINITNKISIGLDIEGRGAYLFSADSSGNRQLVYKRPNGRITLRTLGKLLQQKISIPANGNNQFIITLNLSADWLWNKHADWSATGNFTALKKGTDLLVTTPNMAGIYELWQPGQ